MQVCYSVANAQTHYSIARNISAIIAEEKWIFFDLRNIFHSK